MTPKFIKVPENEEINGELYDTQLNLGSDAPTPPPRPSFIRGEGSSRIPSPVYERPMTVRRRRGSSSLGVSRLYMPSTPDKRSSDATTSSVNTVIRASKDKERSSSEASSLRTNENGSSALAIFAARAAESNKKQEGV